MSDYGFVRTADGRYQPIVDDMPWGDPVPTAGEALEIISRLQESWRR